MNPAGATPIGGTVPCDTELVPFRVCKYVPALTELVSGTCSDARRAKRFEAANRSIWVSDHQV